MGTDFTGRRLLPQNLQMQSFSFAQPSLGPRENQKNYVFVDEHNRHKRLKVMRACEGCRRRKIKCDAATTNTWPCSACIRLKLHCVPPTVSYDRDPSDQGFDGEAKAGEYDGSSGSGGEEDFRQHLAFPHPMVEEHQLPSAASAHVPYSESSGIYNASSYMLPGQLPSRSMSIPFAAFQDQAVAVPDTTYREPIFSSSTDNIIEQTVTQRSKTPDSWHSSQYSPHFMETLGELKIDETGVAPYISRQKKTLAGAPPTEEFDEFVRNLPLPPPGADMTVRIPAELMPSDEQALNYFDIFFTEIHPYVPVIEKSYFYHQWHTNRDSISTLILEAIFATAGLMSHDPTLGQKWLALASKHADAFMDVPRLSTIQAMLLILKARESSPKRGYYYRSWMTIVNLVAMAKDLGLHEHHGLHQAGEPCNSTYNECIVKTRVWQTLFVCELMIGAPQGRTDMAVKPETVDLSIPQPAPGLDDSELTVSRDWMYMAKIVGNVRRMNDTYANLKKKKDWGSDPEFVQLNPTFQAWYDELPPDLQVSFPADGSPPFIRSHFVGNLQSYYNLSIIMLHRPQLACSQSFSLDGEWKQHMQLCYDSAKNLCRLQESILQNFGLSGLLCMQRGIGFTVYAVLTCTVLHLVAITSPDPELNSDARDYFTRHMRILEQCTGSWPMPEMQVQIDALREAFSADVSKPFVLRPSFPYDSAPMGQDQGGRVHMHYRHASTGHHSLEPSSASSYTTHPLSPPLTAGLLDKSDCSAAFMTPSSQPQQQHTPANSVSGLADSIAWNPTRIFDQWNTAFGTPQATPIPGPTSIRVPVASEAAMASTDMLQSAFQGMQPAGAKLQAQQNPRRQSLQHHPFSYTGSTGAAPPPLTPTFVSPSMWQSSVAAVYEDGLKRRWDMANGGGVSDAGSGGVVGTGEMSPLSKRQR